MATRIMYTLSVLLCCLAFAASAIDDVDILQHHDKFSFRYLRAVTADKPSDANVVTSGASIYELLTLLYVGSSGESEEEIKEVLDFPKDKKALVKTISKWRHGIATMPGATVKDASALFLSDDGREVNSNFESAANDLDIGLKLITSGTSVSDDINDWGEQETGGHVGKILPTNTYDAYIANAMYFKSGWSFDRTLTKKRPFYVNIHKTVDVDTLTSTGLYQFGNNEDYDAKFLVLPSVPVTQGGEGAKAIFILPNTKDGLDDTLDAIGDGLALRTFINSMTPSNVTLRVPKFRIETTVHLRNIITKMGISEIFQHGKSGLTQIVEKGRGETPVITGAIQKVVVKFKDIEISDDVDKPKPINVIDFTVDHPFAVLIIAHTKDTKGPQAFNLRVVDPSK